MFYLEPLCSGLLHTIFVIYMPLDVYSGPRSIVSNITYCIYYKINNFVVIIILLLNYICRAKYTKQIDICVRACACGCGGGCWCIYIVCSMIACYAQILACHGLLYICCE